MRSVHITNYYHPSSGGISTSYNHLLEYAERHGRSVGLIVPGAEDRCQRLGEFTRIHYVKAPNSPLFDRRYRLLMPWQFMRRGSRIREILIEERPDVIEICDKYLLGLLAAMIRKNSFRQLGRPMLVQLSCERMDDNISAYLTDSTLGRWLARRLMGNYNAALYDFFIAVSPYVAEEYRAAIETAGNPRRLTNFLNRCRHFFRAAKVPLDDRLFVCTRAGIDPVFNIENRSAEIRREIRTEHALPPESILLLYAGRISPEKNIGLLLEMMENLAADQTADYRLIVAGDGPRAEWFRAEGEKRLPGRIKLLGHLGDKEKLARLYANCDVFVHPNPREPYGIGPLEAMASGIPVVAPRAGGLLTYASDENAWLVDPYAGAFAAAVRQIAANPGRSAVTIEKALATAAGAGWDDACAEVFALYDEMLSRFRRNPELFGGWRDPHGFDFHRLIAKS